MTRQSPGSDTSPGPVVYAIGPAVHPGQGPVTGQKMMFQLSVNRLRERGWRVKLLDIRDRRRSSAKRTKGSPILSRALDYLRIIPWVWVSGWFGSRGTVYLTTAQSLVGFLRDALILWPLSLRRHRIVCHQFGGNYIGFFERQSRIVQAWIRWTLARADAIVVEGPLVQKQFAFLPDVSHKVRPIPNTVSEQSLELPEQPKSLDPNEPIELLYLSNLFESKGYWDVLRATEILIERGRQVRCQFGGEFMVASDSTLFRDPDQARQAFLDYLEARPRLAAAVRYDGPLVGEQKADAFRRAHVFLLPTNYIVEGLPVSILEAMATGCVTIATRHRGIPFMVEEGETGLFVDYKDPQGIADCIERLMDRPQEYRRMSRRSLERFKERFSADSYIRQLEQVLAFDG